MSEPELDDPIARGEDCEECGNFIYECECNEDDPDRYHDEMFE